MNSAHSSTNTWTGFLPKRALVMARTAAPAAQLRAEPTPEVATPQPAPLSGRGNPQAELVFVTPTEELPAERQLLDKMIEAMGITPEQVYVTQTPAALQPKVFVALGEMATRALLGYTAPRRELQTKGSAQVMPTYHPSELLLHPASKRDTWADLQAVAKIMGWVIPTRTK